MDLFENASASLGGAPLNVVVHCHRLLNAFGLGSAVIVSAVGNDEFGRHIRASLSTERIPADYLATSSLSTGSASVFVRNGEPGFEIAQNVAWDEIQSSADLDVLAERCDTVCFGSLAQRSPISRETIRRFLKRAERALVLYDVNLRTNTLSGAKGYSREIVETSCCLATIIKANADEIMEMGCLFGFAHGNTGSENDICERTEFLLKEFPIRAVVVTRGARGAMLATRDEQIVMPSESFDRQVHPVGAGDAFSAGIMFGTSQKWPWHITLELACKMGSWVAHDPSDIPPLSPEISAFVAKNLAVTP